MLLEEIAFSFVMKHTLEEQDKVEREQLFGSPLLQAHLGNKQPQGVQPKDQPLKNNTAKVAGSKNPLGTTQRSNNDTVEIEEKLSEPEKTKLKSTVEFIQRAQQQLTIDKFQQLIMAFQERKEKEVPAEETIAKVSIILADYPALNADFKATVS